MNKRKFFKTKSHIEHSDLILPILGVPVSKSGDYKTIGGTPHLDGEYTVFGEVIDGIEIVSNISMAKTGKMDRPLEDIRILKAKRVR